MSYYLYVIRSGDSRYTGVTKDFKKRILRHNAGKNKSTKHKSNWELVHLEKFNTLGEARRKEMAIKKAKKRYG